MGEYCLKFGRSVGLNNNTVYKLKGRNGGVKGLYNLSFQINKNLWNLGYIVGNG